MDIATVSGDEMLVRCLFHADSNASMRFNTSRGLYICFTCGASGNIKKLMKHLGKNYREPEPDIADVLRHIEYLQHPPDESTPILPDSSLSRYRGRTGYWEGRGLTQETVDLFNLGFDLMYDQATIPVRNEKSELVGVIKRNLDAGRGMPKYMYPKAFPRKHLLFGSWLVADDPEVDTVVLVEGSLDAAPIWQAGHPALGQFGSSLSLDQVNLLRRIGVKKVVLFYDNDPAGVDATRRALEVLTDFLVAVVEYDTDAKDPGELDAVTIMRMINEAKLVWTIPAARSYGGKTQQTTKEDRRKYHILKERSKNIRSSSPPITTKTFGRVKAT